MPPAVRCGAVSMYSRTAHYTARRQGYPLDDSKFSSNRMSTATGSMHLQAAAGQQVSGDPTAAPQPPHALRREPTVR